MLNTNSAEKYKWSQQTEVPLFQQVQDWHSWHMHMWHWWDDRRTYFAKELSIRGAEKRNVANSYEVLEKLCGMYSNSSWPLITLYKCLRREYVLRGGGTCLLGWLRRRSASPLRPSIEMPLLPDLRNIIICKELQVLYIAFQMGFSQVHIFFFPRKLHIISCCSVHLYLYSLRYGERWDECVSFTLFCLDQ